MNKQANGKPICETEPGDSSRMDMPSIRESRFKNAAVSCHGQVDDPRICLTFMKNKGGAFGAHKGVPKPQATATIGDACPARSGLQAPGEARKRFDGCMCLWEVEQ